LVFIVIVLLGAVGIVRVISLFFFTLPTHSYCYILLIVFDESRELTVMNQLVSSESHHGNRDWRCVFGLGASANKLCDIQWWWWWWCPM